MANDLRMRIPVNVTPGEFAICECEYVRDEKKVQNQNAQFWYERHVFIKEATH